MNPDTIIYIQKPYTADHIPKEQTLISWATMALRHELKRNQPIEIVVRIVDEIESADLNSRYRYKQGPTNVLSFPFEQTMHSNLLGDIVICAPLVKKEADTQDKITEAHWAHLVIHGCLHLLGFDHLNDNDAEIMETLEIKLLNSLGFANPYQLPSETMVNNPT